MSRPIWVTGGVGRGSTDKAAFHAALEAAGVEHFNLVTLSSVIPVGAGPIEIVRPPYHAPTSLGTWGDRLYCVMAERTVPAHTSLAIAAGVGWVRHPDGRGLFVEHVAAAASEERASIMVDAQITASLDAMAPVVWDRADLASDRLIVATSGTGAVYIAAIAIAHVEIAHWDSWPSARPVREE